jgi:hypothetical protein
MVDLFSLTEDCILFISIGGRRYTNKTTCNIRDCPVNEAAG